MARLEEICSLITDGSHFSPEDEGVGYPMFSVKDMTPNGFNISGCKKIGEEAYKKLVANGCKPLNDDVVVAKDGSYLKTAFVIKGNPEIALLSSIAILRPKIDLVVPDYLSYFLKSDAVYRTVSLNYITGTALKRIILKGIRKIEVDLPDIGEQEQRAQRLSKVDYLCQLRKQQLDKLDELVKARFVEMFGDPVSNPKHWKTAFLLDIGYCKNGMNFHKGDSGVDIHCLGVGDFKNRTMIQNVEDLPFVSLNELPDPEYLLRDNDIIFVRSNGNKELVGRCLAIYPGSIPVTYSGFCIRYRLTSTNIDTPYLLQVLKTDSIRKKMTGRGANIQNLNQQTLSQLLVPIPPLSLQNEFAAFVERVDQQKQTIQQSLEKLELMKKVLMQEYFG